MKLTKPYFYDSFICTASKCSDNCCIGWEIDIDAPAMECFSRAEGEFGERLRSAIHTESGCPTFAMCEGERCALLREDGLCELILNMGEDSLCDICALHPRFFGWYNGIKEAGLGLCCEEVCRLLFSSREPLTFVTEDIEEPWEETCSEELLQQFIKVRDRIYSVLCDRSVSIGKRLSESACYCRAVQQSLDNGAPLPEEYDTFISNIDSGTVISALLELYRGMESINAEWDERLSALCSHAEELSAALPDFISAQRDELWRYEHIAVYLCYRHFLGGVFECELISRIGLVCGGVLSVMMLDCLKWMENGTLTEWDRIMNLKLWSKQVEYSEENTEAFFDAVWDEASLSPEVIGSCLEKLCGDV